ncbi:porin [Pleionea sediminis]|uniref:porin n=1 Tax=Pleionea sediminis TaxID=2569479 RepID=UPI0011850EE6|nr:porin [Pleionea sediminis]
MVRKPFLWTASMSIGLAGCILASSNASAEIRFNGFANVVVGSTFDDEENTYSYDDKLDFANESLFALQATGDMSDGFSATAQIVARGADSFDAEFSWAYLSYDFSDNSNIKFGRLRIPFYSYSDFVEVGYAYHWVRTPQTVYNVGFDNVDGVSYTYSGYLGDFDSSVQFLVGRFKGTTTPGGIESQTDLKDVMSAVWNLTYNEWTFRLAYSQCGECFVDVPFQDLLGGFDLIGSLQAAGENEAASNLSIDGDLGFFADFGTKYDAGDWFVEAEYAMLEIEDSFQPDLNVWYISGGFRTGEFLWHYTYEENEADEKPELYANIADPALQAAAAGLVDAQRNYNSRHTFGMRYDFHPSAAFKLDYHMIDDETNPDNDRGLISAAIVTVF